MVTLARKISESGWFKKSIIFVIVFIQDYTTISVAGIAETKSIRRSEG